MNSTDAAPQRMFPALKAGEPGLMTTWIAQAIAAGVMAGRNYEAARRIPEAAKGLRKMAAAHLRRAVRITMREAALQHALACTYLDDGVDQLTGEDGQLVRAGAVAETPSLARGQRG